LVSYLKRNYPRNFLTYEIVLPKNVIEYLDEKSVDLQYDKDAIKLLKAYNKSLPIHGITFLTDGKSLPYYVLFNDNGTASFAIYGKSNIIMPDNFYDFMEEMGLTVDAVNNLYNFPRPLEIANSRSNLWPNKIKQTTKLI
jgi:hypothetical protein